MPTASRPSRILSERPQSFSRRRSARIEMKSERSSGSIDWEAVDSPVAPMVRPRTSPACVAKKVSKRFQFFLCQRGTAYQRLIHFTAQIEKSGNRERAVEIVIHRSKKRLVVFFKIDA